MILKKYKYIYFYLTLGIIFFIPLGLKFIGKANKLEVYPSIVLPTGATLLESSNDNFIYKRTVLLAYKDGQNKLEEINIENFLSPIPNQYLFAIYDNDFGLDIKKKNNIIFRTDLIDTLHYRNNYHFSLDMLSNTKAWYRKKLVIQGFEESKFIARILEYNASISTQDVIDISIIDEKQFSLY